MKKLYVGSLPFGMADDSLVPLFREKGYIPVSATIVTDRPTGQSRGFGFVELEREDEATNAIKELDGLDVEGRRLQVNESTPPKNLVAGHSFPGRTRIPWRAIWAWWAREILGSVTPVVEKTQREIASNYEFAVSLPADSISANLELQGERLPCATQANSHLAWNAQRPPLSLPSAKHLKLESKDGER